MRQSVDDGIVNAGSLRQNNWEFANQRSDLGSVSPGAQHANNGERSPGQYPKRHVNASDFSDADFCRDSLLLAVAPQRSDVHLFGLLTQFIFVVEDGANDEIVAANDNKDGNHEKKDSSGEDV